MYKPTEKEKKASQFHGEVVYKDKGKEVARVDMADKEKVEHTTKAGLDPSRSTVSFPGCDACDKIRTVYTTEGNKRYCQECYK